MIQQWYSSPTSRFIHYLYFCCYYAGYRNHYEKLKEFLLSQPSLANKIQVRAKEDKALTYNFVVRLLLQCHGDEDDDNDDGGSHTTTIVLHTKKGASSGTCLRPETLEEKEAILKKIHDVLSKKRENKSVA